MRFLTSTQCSTSGDKPSRRGRRHTPAVGQARLRRSVDVGRRSVDRRSAGCGCGPSRGVDPAQAHLDASSGREPLRLRRQTDMPVIEVEHLHKRYGDTVAVDDISFTVEEGEIFGILGPNGAGKTTTVECVAGLRTPDGGADPGARPRPPAGPGRAAPAGRRAAPGERAAREAEGRRGAGPVRARSTTDPADWRAAARRPGPRRQARHRGTASSPAARSSGCPSRWRWSATREWPILDELTTGLDPQARRDTWELIEQIRDRGRHDRAGHPFHGGGRAARATGSRCIDARPRRRASTPRPAWWPGSTPSSGIRFRPPRRWTTACSPTCPRCGA